MGIGQVLFAIGAVSAMCLYLGFAGWVIERFGDEE